MVRWDLQWNCVPFKSNASSGRSPFDNPAIDTAAVWVPAMWMCSMSITRVGRDAVRRYLTAALLVAGSALWQPAAAQFGGFGFPFYSNPWFGQPAPRSGMPRYQDIPRYRAPRDRDATSITTPPPPNKPEVNPAKTGVVIGDSLAEWLAYGLEQAYAESADLGVIRKVRRAIGLIDRCKGELRKFVEQNLTNEKPVFIAMMFGLNDRRSIHVCEPSEKSDSAKVSAYAFRSKEWAEQYGKEVDELTLLLKAKGVPVFWVGLPPAKNIRAADIDFLNGIFRKHAEKNGIEYINVWDAFVDEDGDFTMRGPDANGQTRLLRAADGLNFTKAGARTLALNLEQGINRTALQSPSVGPPDTQETKAAPAKTNERPVAGPVIPLTGEPLKGEVLLGAGRAASPDSRLLGGEPPRPASGRADDFSWPRTQESPGFQDSIGYAQERSDVAPKSVKPKQRK